MSFHRNAKLGLAGRRELVLTIALLRPRGLTIADGGVGTVIAELRCFRARGTQ